jgi:hypothetical protein
MLIPMRRWFAILLLAVLPLQSTWAAVAAYCGHESNSQVQHLGHHEHQHLGGAVAAAPHSGAADADAPAGFDFDCGHCHGGYATLPLRLDGLATLPAASHRLVVVELVVRTLAPAPPERPQWLRLA